MKQEELGERVNLYLENSFIESSACCVKHTEEWIEAVMLFRDKTQSECCIKTQ